MQQKKKIQGLLLHFNGSHTLPKSCCVLALFFPGRTRDFLFAGNFGLAQTAARWVHTVTDLYMSDMIVHVAETQASVVTPFGDGTGRTSINANPT